MENSTYRRVQLEVGEAPDSEFIVALCVQQEVGTSARVSDSILEGLHQLNSSFNIFNENA